MTRIASLALILPLAGCGLRVYKPIGRYRDGNLHRFAKKPEMGPNLIGLACSGGGSRAAYLSSAVMREIRRQRLRADLPGEDVGHADLLDQLDFVSSVSGGSVAAAYYVLHRDSLRASDSKDWKVFLDKMGSDLIWFPWLIRLAWPPLWFKTLFTNYNRGILSRDLYASRLYGKASLAELPLRPALYLNAVDTFNQGRFVLSRHTIYNSETAHTYPLERRKAYDLNYFDIDPASIRVSDAVYASSAFPFVFPVLPVATAFGLKADHYGTRYLADGGLMDNSGVLTLFNQFEGEARARNGADGRNHGPAFVLGIYIDASVDLIEYWGYSSNDTVRRRKEDFGWKGTVLRQGMTSVGVASSQLERTVIGALKDHGVSVLEFTLPLTENSLPNGRNYDDWRPAARSYLAAGVDTEEPLLRPTLITLRLKDANVAPLGLAADDNAEFELRLSRSGISRRELVDQLPRRLAKISTDFRLRAGDREVLDLAAFLLVNGQLKPRLLGWTALAHERAAARTR